MTVEIRPLNLADVLHVCSRMRQQDWEEVLNLLPRAVSKAETVAMICMQVTKIGFVAVIDGEPAGVVQIAEILDGTYRIGMFGTNRLPEVALDLACAFFDCVPDMLDEGATYCEAQADALHDEAHKFLRFVGFSKRAILPGYGSHGRDIALFTMTKGEAHVHGRRWRRISNARSSTNNGAGIGSDPGAAGISEAAG